MTNSNLTQLASQMALFSKELCLPGIAVFFDEIRSMAITAAEIRAVMKRIGPALIVSTPYNLPTIQHNNFEAVLRITCDCCCHYQAHPPRCQLSKRSISPKQFSYKKYSPKHNPRK